MTQAIHPTGIDADHARSPLRAMDSLTSAQADQVVAGLSSLTGTWDIERHESCDGHLSLLLAHTGHDTSIIVDRDQDGINVSLMLGDKIHASEHHRRTISDTVAAIKTVAASPTLELRRHSA